MKARVRWHEDVAFVAESGSGHAMVVDGAPDHGGRNLGPRPMELILMGLGSCASFDVMTILKKQRQQVSGCTCELEAVRADSVPAVFTEVVMHFTVSGLNLDRGKVERAVSLSAEKYCSASKMLEQAGVVLSHRVTLTEALAHK
jgi:putative redox protein